MWYRRLAVPTAVAMLAGTVVAAATMSALAGAPSGAKPTLGTSFGTAPTPVGYNRQQLRRDDEAMALFEEGQYELDADEPAEAQRIFEKLVEQFPNSDYAVKARRYLDRLYRRSNGQPTLQPIAKTVGPKQPAAEITPRLTKKPSPERAPVMKLRPDRRLQFKLLHTAGDRVFFAPNSAALGSKARRALRNQAAWLNRNTDVLIEIVGHADDGGNELTNLDLSQSRAEAVRARLIEEGVSEDRLRSVALGRTNPIADCPATACSAQNRRVVTRILKVEQLPRENRGNTLAGTRR